MGENFYRLFMVEMEEGQFKNFVWALDDEDAKRQTSQRLHMDSDKFIVTSLTKAGDLVTMDLVLS